MCYLLHRLRIFVLCNKEMTERRDAASCPKEKREKKERERKEKEKIEVRDCGRVLRVY